MHIPLRLRFVLGLLALGPGGASLTSIAVASDCWVYFGTYTGEKSKGIYVSRLDEDGHLSPPELATIASNPSFLAVDPQHRFLYAANETKQFRGEKTGSVTAYAIDAASGRLTRLNQVSSHGAGPAHVAVDGTGRTVLVANYDGGSEASFPVQADGSLGAVASAMQNHGSSVNASRQAAPHAHCFTVDPSNRFALLCDLGLDQVLVFKLDAATARLTPNDPPFATVKPGAGPRHLAFRPDGKFAYVINELDCTLTVFAFEATSGALRNVETVSTLPAYETVQPKFSTAEVCVHPSGKFLYGSNRGHNTIVVYRIDDATGKLTLIEHAPSGGDIPRNFAIDPSGRFLVAAHQESGNAVVFRIDPDSGKLTETNEGVAVDKAVCVAFVPVAPAPSTP